MARYELKEASELNEGDHVRFTDNRWYEVVGEPTLGRDGWVHLRLKSDIEVKPKECTIKPSEELLWHR